MAEKVTKKGPNGRLQVSAPASLDFPANFLKPYETYSKYFQILQNYSLAPKEQKPLINEARFKLKLLDLPLIFEWNPRL